MQRLLFLKVNIISTRDTVKNAPTNAEKKSYKCARSVTWDLETGPRGLERGEGFLAGFDKSHL